MDAGEYERYLERPNAYNLRSTVIGLFSSATQKTWGLLAQGDKLIKAGHSTGKDSRMEGMCRITPSPLLIPPSQRCRNFLKIQSGLSNMSFPSRGVPTFSPLCNSLIK